VSLSYACLGWLWTTRIQDFQTAPNTTNLAHCAEYPVLNSRVLISWIFYFSFSVKCETEADFAWKTSVPWFLQTDSVSTLNSSSLYVANALK
jgi:hypothetical protein